MLASAAPPQGSAVSADPDAWVTKTCTPRSEPGCAPVDHGLIADLRAHDPADGPFALRSSGGFTPNSLIAAGVILERGLDAVIVDFCLSACLEHLLPAFNRVAAHDQPLVLAHGNTDIFFRLLEAETGRTPACMTRYRRARDSVFANKPLPDTAQVQIETVGLSVTATGVDEFCVQGEVNRRHDAWAPTSAELARHFGLEIEGAVAADDPGVLQQRLDSLMPPGTTVISGGQVYTSAND
ncbi:MAG: hypothetical protein RKE49_08090 [Oceanicaulis sp.]